MMVVGFLVFAGALALSVAVIAATMAPQWRRIVRLASGQVEPAFAPLATLVRAERRIAVRRWSAVSAPSAQHRMRAA